MIESRNVLLQGGPWHGTTDRIAEGNVICRYAPDGTIWRYVEAHRSAHGFDVFELAPEQRATLPIMPVLRD